MAVTPIQLRGRLPDCQERNWMLENGFYVKKFFWHTGAPGGPGNPQGGNTEGPRVDFLASTRTIPDMKSQRVLERASRGREMISKATCQAGLIKGVFTKPMTYTNIGPHNNPQSRHRFRRCGFASLLSYFCFLDGNQHEKVGSMLSLR